ncbi:MAG: sugar phosphate isomerase/epimerase [Verrucomicrobiota bacterium]
MISPGLVSVSFRKLSPTEIIALVKQAGLAGIEWGGDIHVPHGDVARAKDVRQQTLDAGLAVLAYGSYYRLDGQNFEAVLASAVALGAPTIRVWAGGLGSAQATAEQRAAVIADSQRIGDLAAKAGIKIAYEFHSNTLTDTDDSAQQLLREVDHPNVYTLWQPFPDRDSASNLVSLRGVLPLLAHVHVYHWTTERRPLEEGSENWRKYFQLLDCAALLEFVQNDDPQCFLRDAATLLSVIPK